MTEEPNGYASDVSLRPIGPSLKPGESAKYRNMQNRELVTVTRFAYRQKWEDNASTSTKNPVTEKYEHDFIRVSPDDCEVKPSYGPSFLYPILALDIAYEPETEKVEEAA